MKGRKPKPTYLKLVSGNPGKRPVNVAEPKPTGDLAAAPEWFTDDQREGWAYAIAHAPPGMLRLLDRSILAIWVVAESYHRQAAQAVSKFGIMTKSPVKAEPMQNPYLAVVNRQALIMVRAAGELGFTPVARSRIALGSEPPAADDDENPFAPYKRG